MNWDIWVVEYAVASDQPLVGLIQGAYADGTKDLPFSFVVARNHDRVVLVDTGFMREGRGEDFCQKFDINRWVSPVRMLEAIGIARHQVTDIVLTHAHYDHAGSIEQFPSARIFIQRQELLTWVEAMALPRRFGYLTEPLDPDDIHSLLNAATDHRLHLLDGDSDDILPGLHVRLAPGHTHGQQFVVFDLETGPVAISGDCVYDRMNITGRKMDGVYMPLGNGVGSTLDQLKSIDRLNDSIKGNLDRLIILHDMERWRQLEWVVEVDGFRICKYREPSQGTEAVSDV